MSLFDLPIACSTVEDLAQEILRIEQLLVESDGIAAQPIDIKTAARLFGAAVRMFIAAGNPAAMNNDDPLPIFGLTPISAVVAAAALLRDQALTPFDLTLWLQRLGSELKRSNSFSEATARAKVAFSDRLAQAEGDLAWIP